MPHSGQWNEPAVISLSMEALLAVGSTGVKSQLLVGIIPDQKSRLVSVSGSIDLRDFGKLCIAVSTCHIVDNGMSQQ